MIIDAIIRFMTDLGGIISSLLHLNTVDALPWGTDSFIVSGVSYFKLLTQYFPPFQTVFDAFLIYLGFKVLVMFGSGIPVIGHMLKKK